MRLLKFYSATFIVLFSLFFNKEAAASHVMGADLSYTCNGNNSYTVVLRLYRDCCGISLSGPESVQLYNGCTNTNGGTFSLAMQGGSGTEVSELCPAQLSQSTCASSTNCPANVNGNPATYPGVQAYTYTGTITLPSACSQWYIRYSTCCRNATISNGSSNDGIGIQAMINNTTDPATGLPYCNTSVAFNTQPVPFVCINSDFTYNNGAVDANGDSLRYTMINPLNDSYNPIAFSAGWSANYPVTTSPPNSFQFDPATGLIGFNAPNQEVDVMAMRVDEYKNGVLVGTTMRDIQVTMLPCVISIPDQEPITNVQNGNQVDSLSVQVCPGTPLTFDIICTDPNNHDLTLTSNINGLPSAIPGAVMTQIGTGDSVIARITWTPLPGDTGCHNFLLTAKNDDCPINGSYTRAYTICVYTEVQLLSASVTFCGTPVQLTATGGTNYTWTPSTGPNAVSNPNIYNPTVSPVSPTMYYFTSDCGTDSVFVNAAPPFAYDAGPGGSICQNGQVHLDATTDNLYAPYHFQWVPGTQLYDPVSNVLNDTIPNPVASPLVTTKYYCYITGANGCTNLDSVTVNVNGSGPNIVAQAQPTLVCPNDPVQLNIVTNPQSCGLQQTPCQGHQVMAQVGTGVTSYPTSPTNYPTIYGHYRRSARHQFLYRQNELVSLIGSGGSIDSIAFYMDIVTAAAVDSLTNFTIKMACTQATDLNTWQPNLVEVFSPKKVMLPAADGWIIHPLDFKYDWDGTSNLVVDVCFNTNYGSQLNRKMQVTPTTFNSVYYSSGSTDQCGNTGTPQTNVNRPNTRFHVCVTDVAGLPISWTPNTGANAPTPTNIVNPIAHPETPVIYNVDVTALNGCHSQDFVYVNVDTSLRFAAFPADTFFCNPTSVTLTTVTTSTTGNPPANAYQWTNLTTNTPAGSGPSITVNPGVTTDYLCTLTGTVCTLRDTVHLVIGNSIPVNMIVDSIDCFGQANGKIKAVSTGGTPPLTYAWSTGPTIDSIQNLSPGTYSVTINDSQGCTGSATVNLSQPSLLTLSAAAQNINCFGANNGTVTLTTAGGTPAYNYTWNPAQPNSATATGLAPNNYSATVTDAFGCTASASATVSQPTALVVSTFAHDATSFGGNEGWAYTLASGGTPGYTYTWNTGSNNDTIQNLVAGTYYVTVCDANGCCKPDSAIVNDPPPILLTFVNVQNLCFGDCNGTSAVSASGGISPYVFNWSTGLNNSNSVSNLCAGTYTVTATDSAGVSVSANVVITQPTQISIVFDTVDISCFGANDGSALAIASGGTGGFTYNWGASGTLNPNTNLGPGTYTVTATDANNCTAQASWTAIEPPQLTVLISTTTNVSCFGGNNGGATATANGGTPAYAYAWSNLASTANPVTGFSAGNQTVTVTDSHTCTATAAFVITEPTQLTVVVSSVTDVLCNGGSNGAVDITAAGGTIAYTYLWSNIATSEDLNGVAANTYSVTVTDANSCVANTTATITEPTAITLSFNHTDPLCNGDADGTADVTANGGTPTYTYDWANVAGSNNLALQQNIPAGTYDVTVYDNNQCVATGNVTLTDPPLLNAQLINKQEISCSNATDGSVDVTVTGGTPPIDFAWSNGTPVSLNTNLGPGNYLVTVTDANGCFTILNETFVAPWPISIDVLWIDSASCPEYSDGAIHVSAIGGTPGSNIPYEYSIDGTNFQSSEFFLDLPSGVYDILIRDSEGCTKDTTVTIGEPLKPTLTILPQDSMIDLGESITLVSTVSIYSGADINFYTWSPISGLNCSDCASVIATPYKQTEYNLTLNYLANCTVNETVTVMVGNGEDFFIPTAFTPNGDGNNDVFTVYGTGLAKVNLKIFNRWGEKVYDSNNQWSGWDGTYKGALQNPGVYTYHIDAVYLNGKERERKGTITLVR